MGPYPEGDPEALRALAAELRRVAAILAAAPHPAVDGWQSDAARRVRSVLDGAAGTAGRVAGDLGDCAARLDRAAVRLDTDQRAWLQRSGRGRP